MIYVNVVFLSQELGKSLEALGREELKIMSSLVGGLMAVIY